MRVRDWMTTDPVFVTPDTLILEAKKKMDEFRIRHLPVLQKGKLVGMLTRRHITEAEPSSATSLSVHEMQYLLSKLRVNDVMKKDPICVTPETPVEDTVLLGYEKGIGAFPVLEGNRLVGIVTETEITRAFFQVFATKEDVIRITLLSVDLDKETFPRITQILRENDAIPLSIFSVPKRSTDQRNFVIRCKGKKTRSIVDGLKKAGYIVERIPRKGKS